MMLAIHHPQYLPNSSWFARLLIVDTMVLLDDTPMPDRNREIFVNRNAIRHHEGKLQMTVPVLRSPRHTPVNRTLINPTAVNWQSKHLRAIIENYNRSLYISHYVRELQKIYRYKWKLLIDINMELIRFHLDVLGIRHDKIVLSSALGVLNSNYSPTDLCRTMGASKYLAGPAEFSRLSTEVIQSLKCYSIKLAHFQWKSPEYRQCNLPFIADLTALDLILNEGPYATGIMKSAAQISW